MKFGRIFVTSVVLLAMAAVTACNHDNAARRAAAQTETDRKAALVKEGNDKIAELGKLREDLKENNKIFLPSLDGKDGERTRYSAAEKYDWPLEKRNQDEISAKLARVLQLSNRILEIDAQRKVVVVKNRDMIVATMVAAENFQRSLEAFVAKSGGR